MGEAVRRAFKYRFYPTPRQADQLNEEWVAAYHRDVAARGSRGEPDASGG